jgi:Ca2+-binding EF-hand superfamily protein
MKGTKAPAGKRPPTKAPTKPEFMLQNPTFTEEQCDELQEIFNTFADKKTQLIKYEVLVHTLKTLNLDTKNPLIMKILGRLSSENEEGLDFETFLQTLTEAMGYTHNETGRATIFSVISADGDKITQDDMKVLIKEVGVTMSQEKLEELFKKIGKASPEEIRPEEFESHMSRFGRR